VLNAKHHEKEAEIIAQAGKFGTVTIATNMAGRGTDIMLGGNAEYLAKSALRHDGLSEEMIIEATGFADTEDPDILAAREKYTEYYNKFKAEIAPEAEKVREAGGLAIIGTERHDSRRIDNQLRGRAGRQGDNGNTQFFISLEDDLMRLFGGERIYSLMDTLKVDEDMPLENSILSHTIENAQKKKEGINFAIRKNVLQYDDVMNKQREIIYAQRNKVLDGEDLKATVLKMIDDTIEAYCQIYMADEGSPADWDMKGLREHFLGWITAPDDLRYTTDELVATSREAITNLLKEKAHDIYEKREEEFGSEMMREIERVMLLRSVDTNWMDHIDAMDQLRQGIGLRAYGQHDPVIEYRNDSYDMFEAMTNTIREQTAKLVLSVRVRKEEGVKREKVAKETSAGDKPLTVRGKGVVSKNALCPCGSGKKYKRCCGKDED
jgi:preprotein translocase subunit SecA